MPVALYGPRKRRSRRPISCLYRRNRGKDPIGGIAGPVNASLGVRGYGGDYCYQSRIPKKLVNALAVPLPETVVRKARVPVEVVPVDPVPIEAGIGDARYICDHCDRKIARGRIAGSEILGNLIHRRPVTVYTPAAPTYAAKPLWS